MNLSKIIIIGSAVLFLGFVFLIYLGVVPGLKFGPDRAPATVEIWSVFDDQDVLGPLVLSFQEQYPNTTLTYQKKSVQDYEDELIRAFAVGKGPDIFMLHNTWLSKHGDLLSPAPADIFPIDDFRKRFVDVVQKDFTYKNNIWGVPLYVDTLALYYNINLFNSAGYIKPPENWEEFGNYAKFLTKKGPTGDIMVSGTAAGSGRNVLRSSDIFSLLVMQNGGVMSDSKGKVFLGTDKGQAGGKSLDFYTKFAKKDSEFYGWSPSSQSNSVDVFAQGRAAMAFSYSSELKSLSEKAPRLRYEVAPMPQLKGSVLKKNYANYWGYGVYLNSPDKNASWQFLKFLAEPKNAAIYLAGAQRPASQKSILEEQQKDPKLSVFANQALTADSWLQLDNTLIEESLIKMLDQQVLSEQAALVTLSKAVQDINSKILSK